MGRIIEPPHFTRIDGDQISDQPNGCTRLHPEQLERNWAIRMDRPRDEYGLTSACLPRSPRAVEELITLPATYDEFNADRMKYLAPYLERSPEVESITIVVAPEIREEPTSTRVLMRQVHGYMRELAKLICK